MKIAIVEDNLMDQNRLKGYLEKTAQQQNLLLEVELFSDGIEFIDQYHPEYDLVYFDVEMPILDGMSAAKKLRKVDEKVMIVFVTNYVQHAIGGYTVGAYDFLLKPLTEFNFQEHFIRVLKKFAVKEHELITVKSGNEMRRIILSNLLYVESQGHYLYLHLQDETIMTIDTMRNMENKLSKHGFFRSNNSYIINLKYVRSVDKNMVDVGGEQLQISRPRRKAFMEALTNFIGDE